MANGTLEFDDLAGLDREIARAVKATAAWRDGLFREDDPATRRGLEAGAPLESFRRVAGQTAFVALADKAERAERADDREAARRAAAPLSSLAVLAPLVSGDAPLREGLRRWIVELTLARLARDRDVALAEALRERNAPLDLDPPALVSYGEALRGFVAAATPRDEAANLAALAARGADVASAIRARREVRVEVARRLGLASPDALSRPAPRDELRAGARRLLDETEDLWAQCLRDAKAKAEPGAEGPFGAVRRVALGTEAREGWPSRLTARWLLDLFGELARGLRLPAIRLPEAWGGASFARALGAFGRGVALAGVSPSLPFALAFEPQAARANRFALVFASLVANDAFFRRALGTTARIAEDQARIMTRASLYEARVRAARLLLADELAPPTPGDFEELTARVLGRALPAALAGAWPVPRGDEAAAWLAVVDAPDVVAGLVGRFDDDWFRNPRAVQHLRAVASAPAFEGPAESAAASLVASSAASPDASMRGDARDAREEDDEARRTAIPRLARAFEERLA